VRCCSATPGVLAIWLFGAAAGSAYGVTDAPRTCPGSHAGPARPTPPPITTLRTRDAELAIYSIAGELRYTVIERSGRVTMHLGTERDFVVHFPALAEHVEVAFADESSFGAAGGWLDASAPMRSSPEATRDPR
jgi:hypothetical protein